PDGSDWLSVGGRGFRLDPHSLLAREEWLAVAEVGGMAAGARILAAAPIDQARVEALFADRVTSGTSIAFVPESGGVRASQGRRLGAIQLSGGADARADPVAVAQALVEGVRTYGLDRLPWSTTARSRRRRALFARTHDPSIPDLSDESLLVRLDEWLPVLVENKRKLSDIDAGVLS